MSSGWRQVLAVGAGLALAGCAPEERGRGEVRASLAQAEAAQRQEARFSDARASMDPAGAPVVARAQMRPVGEGTARGTIEFRGEEGYSMAVNVMMLGLVAGAHAIHVHAGVDCTAADEHVAQARAPSPAAPREGELGNVTAEASGLVHETLRDPRLRFDRALVGQLIVVHAGPEDLIARPGGGAAIACGVIETVGRAASPIGRPPRRLHG